MDVNIGIIGLGYWGPNLLRNFHASPDSNVIICCDSQADRCRKFAVQFPNFTYSQLAEDVINHPEVNAVAIATPVQTHYELAKQALLAGKHVLITKPMTDDLDEARKLVELADKMKCILQVDHTFIFHPAVEKLKDIVTRGELGELYYFDSVRINLGLFQSDVSVIWDLAPHDVSIMDYLIDRPVQWVQAIGVSHAGHKSESMAYITVQFAGNVLGHCHVNWLAPMKTRLVMLGGSRRLAVYDDNLVTEKVKIYDKGITRSSIEGLYDALVQYRNGDMYAPAIENSEALGREIKHFNHCVKHSSTPITDGKAGLRVVSILTAAQESSRNNGIRVIPASVN
ncbi:MAG TPA: Gfo/Idh/MocA family oxidoreductase [Candidatus Limnocylindrales bacterium]|nr:Gfo/Idh/MocA family oxidoreductase [Candidatus Limnocylindrales bacterium]